MKLVIGVILYGKSLNRHEKLFTSIAAAKDILTRYVADAKVLIYLKTPATRTGQLSINADFVDENRANLGFGASHNRLMKHAFHDEKCDLYLCLNNDTIVDPFALIEAYRFYCDHKKNSLFEAIQTPLEHPKPYNPLTGQTPWCSGAALFLTADIYHKTNGFDENFFMYCEDVDLSWRVLKNRDKCFILPKARIFHEVNLAGSKPREITKQMLESARYLGYKWGAASFSHEIEEILVKSSFYPTRDYLPPLDVSVHSYPIEGITEFRQLLSFCLPRW